MLIFKLKRMTELLYNEWDMGKKASGAKGKTCAYIYLFEILSETEKLVLKKENNKIVGFAGYSNWNSKKRIIPKKIYGLMAKILINGPLVKNKQAIYDYNKAYDVIPSDLSNYFDGELSILIVDKKYRGKGYGKALLNKIFSLAKIDNMRNMQILTDESCNFKFYNAMDCKRIRKLSVSKKVSEKGEDKYIYEKVLKEGEENEV